MFDQIQDSNEEQINNFDFNDDRASKEEAGQPKIGLTPESNRGGIHEDQPEQPLEIDNELSKKDSLGSQGSAPQSKKKPIIIVAVILGVILISGGLLFAADRFFDIEISFISKLFKSETSENVVQTTLQETPEEVIGKMFSSFKNIKTSQDLFEIEITDKDDNKITNISVSGSYDLSAFEKKKIDYTFKMSQPDSEVNVFLDFRYVDETAYIKLLEGSKIPLFDLSGLQDKWFYFSSQKKKDLGIVSGDDKKTAGLNEDEQETILELLKKAKLFKTAESIEGDTINSTPVFHYMVTLDSEGFAQLMDKLQEAEQDKINNQNFPIPFPKERIDEMKDSMKNIKDMPIEIWIEKGTYFLRKVSVENFETDVTKPDGTKGKANILLNIELNNINDPVNIEAPEGGQSLEQIMQSLFSKMVGQTSLSQSGGMGFGTMDMTKDNDGDGLTNQDEFFYNTNPTNPDTDGDGFLDGDEVKNGYNPNGPGKLLTFSKNPVVLSEAEYNDLLSRDISGYKPEGTSVNLGPAVLELTNFWDTNLEPTVWLELKMIPLPNFNLGIKNGKITIENVLTKDGKNVYNFDSTFESEDFKTFSFSEESYPILHLNGIRSVHLSGGVSEDDIASIRGSVILMLPIDMQTLTFSSADIGVEKVVGDRTFTLQSIEGGKVTMGYKGPGDINFVSNAYDKDGSVLDYSYRTTGFPKAGEQDTTYEDMYDGDIKTVKIVIPTKTVERTYPFELKK